MMTRMNPNREEGLWCVVISLSSFVSAVPCFTRRGQRVSGRVEAYEFAFDHVLEPHTSQVLA